MAARKAKKPKHQKSEYPTLPGQLGYLNSYYCPVCGKHLFLAYDKDMKKDREDGYYFHVSNDFNYCSKCGQLLDLDEWKRREEEPAAAGEELTLEALKGKVMLYEQDGKIYLVDSREETTGGQDNE